MSHNLPRDQDRYNESNDSASVPEPRAQEPGHAIELERQLQVLTDELETQKKTFQEKTEANKRSLAYMRLGLSQKDQMIANLTAKLDEIYGSTGWKILQKLWRTQARMRSFRVFRWLERLVKASFRKFRPGATPLPIATPPVPIMVATQPNPFVYEQLLDPSNKLVILLAPTFFDWDGNNMFCGGAERYLIELSHLIQSLDYEPVIVQCGNFDWMRYYYDIRVIGLKVEGSPETLTQRIEEIQPHAALILYSPFFLASSKLNTPSIGISHGVYWDDATFHGTSESLEKTTANLLGKLSSVKRIVSVDTNTINWLRTNQSELTARAVYIPNFVDLGQFQPASRSDDRVVVLYPRRLYRPRGFWLIAEILPELIQKYPQVDFHFVGKGDITEEVKVQEWVQEYEGRVKHSFFSPSEMHLAYQQADITIIPTIHSEGTSLSCLEAMASKNAVIATNVGGLTNLVIDGHNGILIEPTAADLKNAIEKLILQPELRYKLAENGRQTVERSFTLERWRAQWKPVLSEFLPDTQAASAKPLKTLVFPYSGIAWEGIKQRPHHIATEFVKRGYEVFWFDPHERGTPARNIHLLSQKDDLYLENPLFLIYYPYNYEEISKFRSPTVIYDILDDISIFDHITWDEPGKSARDYFVRLLQRADIVLTSSRILLNQVRDYRPDVLFVPNGVYLDHFNPDNCTVADEIKSISRPIVGFHGAIADWVDIKLLAELVNLRPNYQFVLVGPVSIPSEVAELKRRANIHIIDSVPYELIPSYVNGFDVGILPFKLSQLTHAVRPLKVLEYLSMGKPVVATPVEELKDWPGILLAEDSQGFAASLDRALQADGILADKQAIANFLKNATWSEVIKPLMDKLHLL